jgi:hypothetical protein
MPIYSSCCYVLPKYYLNLWSSKLFCRSVKCRPISNKFLFSTSFGFDKYYQGHDLLRVWLYWWVGGSTVRAMRQHQLFNQPFMNHWRNITMTYQSNYSDDHNYPVTLKILKSPALHCHGWWKLYIECRPIHDLISIVSFHFTILAVLHHVSECDWTAVL